MIKSYQNIVCATLMAAVAVGCSSHDALSETEPNEEEETVVEERYGALSAEYVVPRAPGDDWVDVQAQFLDARGVPVESALEALEVWMPRRGLEADVCETVNADATPPTARERVSLHLLDVGQLEIVSPREEVVLEARRLPDLLSSFYGVVYGTEWSDGASDHFVEYYPGSEYRFAAPGSVQTGGFDITVEAPDPIVLMAANGNEIRDQRSLSVDPAEALELVWASDGAPWDGDEVFIDLSAGFGPDQVRVQCRTHDDGAFTISASELRELSEFSGEVDLELRRVRRAQTEVEGLEQVDVQFATTDKIELQFE